MAQNQLTGHEFLKALTDGSLVEPLIVEGAAKRDTNNHNSFLFSAAGSCGPWIEVPADAVAGVTFLRTIRCQYHEHPYVRLQLKEPPKDNTLAALFAGLVRQPPTSPRTGMAVPPAVVGSRRPLSGTLTLPPRPADGLVPPAGLPAQKNIGLATPAALASGSWSWLDGHWEDLSCGIINGGNVYMDLTVLSIFEDGTFTLFQKYHQHWVWGGCSISGTITVNLTVQSSSGASIPLPPIVSPPLVEEDDKTESWNAGPFGPIPLLRDQFWQLWTVAPIITTSLNQN